MERNITPLISVIVPIYNVEKYIHRCLDSILRQTYKNLEIILIDDGSTDQSANICEEYKKKDERIQCIHKINGGLSEARNVGMRHATGIYMTFIDGDDYIALDYVEYLFSLLSKYAADIAVCNYQKVLENQNIIDQEREKVIILLGDEGLENLLYQKYYTMSAWAKLYKREMINSIEFPVGKVHEDVGTVYQFLSNSKKTVFGSKKKYGYVQREKSIINSEFKLNKMDYIEFTKQILQFVESEKKTLYRAAVSRHFSACFQIIIQIPKDKKQFYEAYKELIQEVDRYKGVVIWDKKARMRNRFAASLAFISPDFAVSILKLVKR
ncbi:glycosyl transferase family 2 [Lachnotalea glycerini]|uniref:Glycosyl transferase family 2 n=1 Tax=Lachnotalea glycerini TaxID=1763509 RepID=A0A318ETD3_9FIRM|nr:glycosyltransferase [Lachnotalea glycerini]PXV91460.1 glycosyl transferase family 2 [Lachnotalea glycerini]